MVQYFGSSEGYIQILLGFEIIYVNMKNKNNRSADYIIETTAGICKTKPQKAYKYEEKINKLMILKSMYVIIK
jgi:DUF2075 family protein